MIVLTNCLSATTDEGGIKVAHTLAERIKKRYEHVTLISYGEHTGIEDVRMKLNKLMISRSLAKRLRSANESVLLMPQYARMLPMAIRAFVLSRYVRNDLWILLSMKSELNAAAKWLLKKSGAKVIAVSEDSWRFFQKVLGDDAFRLKTGVDTKRFAPAGEGAKEAIRKKYQIPQDKTVVLHVGHMARGRNIAQLLALDDRFHAVLVVSTKTKAWQDEQLSGMLKQRSNITVIDTYLPDIEALYQMADVYFFPVEEELNCIDVPLSVLEAAACGIPVAATPYGELSEMMDLDGFYRIESFERDALNDLLERAAREKKNPRKWVLAYDWDKSVEALARMIG